MPPVKRARYVSPTAAARSRMGGLPSHLPPQWPRSAVTGTEMGFLGQFYSAELAPFLSSDLLCLQLYQPLENYSPTEAPGELSPLVISVPHGARENVAGEGVRNPHIRLLDIEWVDDVEPEWVDALMLAPEEVEQYIATKFGGAAPDESVHRSSLYVGILAEGPEGLNLGVPSLVLIKRAGQYELVMETDLY